MLTGYTKEEVFETHELNITRALHTLLRLLATLNDGDTRMWQKYNSEENTVEVIDEIIRKVKDPVLALVWLKAHSKQGTKAWTKLPKPLKTVFLTHKLKLSTVDHKDALQGFLPWGLHQLPPKVATQWFRTNNHLVPAHIEHIAGPNETLNTEAIGPNEPGLNLCYGHERIDAEPKRFLKLFTHGLPQETILAHYQLVQESLNGSVKRMDAYVRNLPTSNQRVLMRPRVDNIIAQINLFQTELAKQKLQKGFPQHTH